MKLSKRKIELMLVDIAIIICVYYMTALVGILRLHSIVLNGELNLIRLTALVIMLMTPGMAISVYLIPVWLIVLGIGYLFKEKTAKAVKAH